MVIVYSINFYFLALLLWHSYPLMLDILFFCKTKAVHYRINDFHNHQVPLIPSTVKMQGLFLFLKPRKEHHLKIIHLGLATYAKKTDYIDKPGIFKD